MNKLVVSKKVKVIRNLHNRHQTADLASDFRMPEKVAELPEEIQYFVGWGQELQLVEQDVIMTYRDTSFGKLTGRTKKVISEKVVSSLKVRRKKGVLLLSKA